MFLLRCAFVTFFLTMNSTGLPVNQTVCHTALACSVNRYLFFTNPVLHLFTPDKQIQNTNPSQRKTAQSTKLHLKNRHLCYYIFSVSCQIFDPSNISIQSMHVKHPKYILQQYKYNTKMKTSVNQSLFSATSRRKKINATSFKLIWVKISVPHLSG